MKIDHFKVKDIDPFAGRVSEIRTSKGTFRTPARAVVSTEYNYKKNLKVQDPFSNNMGEYVARFNEDDLRKFATKNGSYKSRLQAGAAYADQMRYVLSKAYPQCPIEYHFDEDTLKLLMEFQVDAGLDLVSIPYWFRKKRDLVPYFRKWAVYAEKWAGKLRRVVAVPQVPIRLGEEIFQRTMKALWDERSQFPAVGLIYGSMREYKINYAFLRKQRGQDTWLHMSGVPQTLPIEGQADLANMHVPQVYGIDTVATNVPPGGGGNGPGDYQTLRYFDRPTLTLPRIKQWVKTHGSSNPGCSCPICKRQSFESIIKRFGAQKLKRLDLGPLYGVFRLHEVYQSTDEFAAGQTFISENRFAEYLESKIGRRATDEFRENVGKLEDFEKK